MIETISNSTGLDSIERTFISFIQQYLSLLLYDNATFFAERMVAYRPSARAVYLLAICHFRNNAPKRARSVLLDYDNRTNGRVPCRSGHYGRAKMGLTMRTSTSGGGVGSTGAGGVETGASSEDMEAATTASNMTYLLAKCCFDLGLYHEAEDCLLRECRLLFACSREAESRNPGDGNSKKTLEEWIMRSDPCPVPKGAAGLYILGSVYRCTHRKDKAATYYRMSLKLDPMMWASYEAMCEMGCASSPTDDPATIFGVLPEVLRSIPVRAGGYAPNDDNLHEEEDYRRQNGDTMLREESSSPPPMSSRHLSYIEDESNDNGGFPNLPTSPVRRSEFGSSSASHRHSTNVAPSSHHHHQTVERSRYSIPSPVETPYDSELVPMDRPPHHYRASIEEGTERERERKSSYHYSSRGGRRHDRASDLSTGRGSLPSTNLFAFPDLTPIQPDRDADTTNVTNTRDVHDEGINSEAPSSPTILPSPSSPPPRHRQSSQISTKPFPSSPQHTPSFSNDDTVYHRAQRVAARLYYEPSIETTPPHRQIGLVRGQRERRKRMDSLKVNKGKLRMQRMARGDGDGVLGDSWAERMEGEEVENCDNSDGDEGHRNNTDTDEPITAPPETEGSYTEKRVLFDKSVDAPSSAITAADVSRSTTVAAVAPEPKRKQKRSQQQQQQPVQLTTITQSSSQTQDGDHTVTDTVDEGGETGGVRYVLELLCTLGAAQRMLCWYNCQEAIRIFQTLPLPQFNTGWVQHQVGRAYFEIADYSNAQLALETMQRLEPHRMKGLEILSTTLWHLKKEVELANLAQRAVDFDRKAPESWCVVGNCFSLQKEHESALTFFRRSIQLDESFAYSHTLSGHEYVSNEDFDQAVACFRHAIRVNDRHYTAWYGLGAIYFRQEKYDLAEYHFGKAIDINPRSSVLHCHLGMAQHTNGKPFDALETLAGAFRIDPRNPQALYQRATIFMAVDRPREALAELEKVRDAAPREASVHFSMGRVLKRLGKPEEAMRSFLTALDLDPKDNNLIKAAIDRLDEPDVDEDVSAF